jgi:hypothetical protein
MRAASGKSGGAPASVQGSIFACPLFFWSFSFGEAKEKRVDEQKRFAIAIFIECNTRFAIYGNKQMLTTLIKEIIINSC